MKKDISTNGSELENIFSEVTGVVESKKISSPKKRKKKLAPRITLRLSEEENTRLKTLSQDMTISAYIRKCIFGENTTRRKRRSHRPVQDQESMAKMFI